MGRGRLIYFSRAGMRITDAAVFAWQHGSRRISTVKLPQCMALVSCPAPAPPAQPLVCALLVAGHEVHELQACALVVRAQQRLAVVVDLPHAGERAEEGGPHLLALQGRHLGAGGGGQV